MVNEIFLLGVASAAYLFGAGLVLGASIKSGYMISKYKKKIKNILEDVAREDPHYMVLIEQYKEKIKRESE